jgi:hypothetical protein
METEKNTKKSDNQVTGNIGLFFVCYHLAKLGWNVMPTSRNARGVDVLIYNDDAKQKYAIQVKALSKRAPVPLGKHLDNLMGDFFVICRNVRSNSPECFVLTPDEVHLLAHKGEKKGKISYWLQPKKYETKNFKENWNRIGSTLTSS